MCDFYVLEQIMYNMLYRKIYTQHWFFFKSLQNQKYCTLARSCKACQQLIPVPWLHPKATAPCNWIQHEVTNRKLTHCQLNEKLYSDFISVHVYSLVCMCSPVHFLSPSLLSFFSPSPFLFYFVFQCFALGTNMGLAHVQHLSSPPLSLSHTRYWIHHTQLLSFISCIVLCDPPQSGIRR